MVGSSSRGFKERSPTIKAIEKIERHWRGRWFFTVCGTKQFPQPFSDSLYYNRGFLFNSSIYTFRLPWKQNFFFFFFLITKLKAKIFFFFFFLLRKKFKAKLGYRLKHQINWANVTDQFSPQFNDKLTFFFLRDFQFMHPLFIIRLRHQSIFDVGKNWTSDLLFNHQRVYQMN